jgi:DNA-binding NarL/FixJ family response regulator
MQEKIVIARLRTEAAHRVAPPHYSVEEVWDMRALLEAMSLRKPSVLLLSIDFPGLGGAPGVAAIHRLSTTTRIVVLSGQANPQEELEVLRAGARGYCGPLETEMIMKMIDRVQHGEVWAGRKTIGALLDEFDSALTEPDTQLTISAKELELLTFREREILRLLGEGASNKEIANTLNVSVATIKAHFTKIFRKLGHSDRVRLALFAAGARRDI